MKHTITDEACKRRLARAESVSAELRKAGDEFLKISEVLKDTLLPLVSGKKLIEHWLDHPFIQTRPVVSLNSLYEYKDYWDPIVIDRGLLQSSHSLKDLIADLLAADISPAHTTPENIKRQRECSFAYFLGAFSALALRRDVESEFLQICQAGRDEALELSVAAVFCAEAETLGEIQRGIKAVEEMAQNHSRFSRHVAAARRGFRELKEKGADHIFKGEVRRAAIDILSKQGFIPYDDTDYARWREVIKAAGLSGLPQERGKRAQ